MVVTDIFLYGSLRHAPLLAHVLGPAGYGQACPAVLDGHAVHWVAGGGYPAIVARDGARTEGLLLRDPSAEARARLDFYELGFGYELREVSVIVDGESRPALVYFPLNEAELGPAWTLEDWVERWWPITQHAAREVMSYYGQLTGDEVAERFSQILVRAASTERARSMPAPVTLRSGRTADDLEIHDRRRVYSNFFTVEEADFSFPRFDGTQSATVSRAGFVMGDAVTVVPYDPVRDRVMIIEQFRFAPFLRGDPLPWLLEPIAGRVDPGESAEDCARREAMEETGLEIGAVEFVASYYPSPGAVTEHLYSYVALADLPDEAAGVAGLEEEHENIRSHVLPFDRFMELIGTGEINVGPLILTAFWLQQNRARLRGLA